MLSSVISALNQALVDLGLEPPIVWENVDPPKKESEWLAAYFLPASTVQSSLGDTGLDQTTGIYQIDVHTETGIGWGSLHALADQIQSGFRLGRCLEYQGQKVTVTGSSRTQGGSEGGWFKASISIQWLAYIARQ
ncbi:DUF4128 domain-containing protein [Endozoicomonas sp. ONNA1]|uniref:DUF4128 domain-containing protein n=1 Tax=Endozoicomonas sp. ONNA1 TaxID=2828740 RepID=UPI0021483F1C|nr:DUF4128 domain-containing protein [Endozoicomonas sp. ONNA1]